MKTTGLSLLGASLALTLTLSAPGALRAQDAKPPAPAAPGASEDGRTRRGSFNPEEFRKRMNERLKTALKATDEEWSVLQPLIEKVQTAQRGTGGGFRGRGFGGGPGGPGGPGGNGGPGAGAGGPPPGGEGAPAGGERFRGGSPESQALRTTLEDENASPTEIKAKLAALRESRKKAQGELTQAQDELRKVLTPRQEAVLVAMGMLE